jgi:hypothetical protein
MSLCIVNLRVEEVTKPLTPSLEVDHLETDMQQFDSVKSVASSDKQQLLFLLYTAKMSAIMMMQGVEQWVPLPSCRYDITDI